MRNIFILIIGILSIPFIVFSQSSIKSILILGDSNLKGHFGEFLQKTMHNSGKYDVLSIAIGGAGSKTFLPPMKNMCCGYRVRKTCAGMELVKLKKNKETKVPVLERAEKPTTGIVMKAYSGNLLSIMNAWNADAVVLVLGTNYLNAHEELLKIIRTYNENIPIIWVGPFDKSSSTSRYTLIDKALESDSNCFLVHSDSIVDKLKIVPDHLYGIEAKKLAEAVFAQFEPFLTTTFTINNKVIMPFLSY